MKDSICLIDTILYANSFAELPFAAKEAVHLENFTYYLHEKHCLSNTQSMMRDGCEAMDGALFIINIQWLFLSFATVSALTACATLAVSCILTLGVFASIFYFTRQHSQHEKQKLIDQVMFTYLQVYAATYKIAEENPHAAEDAIKFLKNADTLIRTPGSIEYDKSKLVENTTSYVLPCCLLTSGLLLTCAWGLPNLLIPCGVSIATATAITPISFIVFGALALLLAAVLAHKAYKSYQTKAEIQCLVTTLNSYKQGILGLQTNNHKPNEQKLQKISYQA